jgi:hypothetical protein
MDSGLPAAPAPGMTARGAVIPGRRSEAEASPESMTTGGNKTGRTVVVDSGLPACARPPE